MNQLFNKGLWAVLVLVMVACQSTTQEQPIEEEQPVVTDPRAAFLGAWEARWHTTQEAFPDVTDAQLTMDGVFDFSTDSISVTLYGYPGCLFSHDTLSNQSRWALSGDTLSLINEDNTPGITYEIKSQDSTKVEMVFLEDIFVTLTR